MRGRCLCGTVEFEIDGDVRRIYQCHCSLCRKQGGSSSNSATIIPAARFHWVSGWEHVSSYVKPTGFRSDFCANCGSPIPNPLRTTDYYWVPVGLFDGDIRFEVVAHLFVDSRASWDSVASDAPQYGTTPTLPELLDLLGTRP